MEDKRTLRLRVAPELYARVADLAKSDRRSMSNYVVCVLEALVEREKGSREVRQVAPEDRGEA